MSTVSPNGSGGSEEARRVVQGWKAVQQGKKNPMSGGAIQPNKKVMNESDAKQQEEPVEFDMKKAKEFMKKKLETQQKSRVFTGTPQLCMMLLSRLFVGDEDHAPSKNVNIIKVEESTLGTYKITYTND